MYLKKIACDNQTCMRLTQAWWTWQCALRGQESRTIVFSRTLKNKMGKTHQPFLTLLHVKQSTLLHIHWRSGITSHKCYYDVTNVMSVSQVKSQCDKRSFNVTTSQARSQCLSQLKVQWHIWGFTVTYEYLLSQGRIQCHRWREVFVTKELGET